MNKQEIIPFNFNGNEVRVVEENGNVLFCGKDVAVVLGYENPGKAVRDHCKQDGGPKRYPIVDKLGRTQKAVFITEGDLYRLIVSSKLPSAQEFETWVFEEVLPSIRQHGGYMPGQNGRILMFNIRLKASPRLAVQLQKALYAKPSRFAIAR